ncbi:MAG: DUF2431 domain-containing protein [Thermoplasmata archaeon]|nr:DUF2431 domain-containing protein [Thermoplasmata archaeon]
MPYPISEDTLLLLKHLKCGRKTLEMGTGNGIIAIECAKSGSKVVAVDIDPEAIEELKLKSKKEGLRIEARVSNLFQNVSGRFDVIIFNPPYLPGNPKELEDLQWAGGGKFGDEIIMRFLSQAKDYLSPEGEIYIILSSFNRLGEIKKMPYRFKLIAKEKFAFHEIYLYQLKPIHKT